MASLQSFSSSTIGSPPNEGLAKASGLRKSEDDVERELRLRTG